MYAPVSAFHQHVSIPTEKLLAPEEIIVIVDDDQGIRDPLQLYLSEQGLATEETDKAEYLLELLNSRKVALVLLDIGLPGMDGISILPQIVEEHPDVAVVMLTGVADLQVALDCMRKGADDYLSKPVEFSNILFVVKKTLEKRRLLFENRKYQEELEKTQFRIQLLHQLSIKMNTVYLSTVELDEILHGILVGITANEGLRFNRAFLALFDASGQVLEGRLAIGPGCREEAGNIWSEMQDKNLPFLEIVHNRGMECADGDVTVNSIVRSLQVPNSESDHLLIKAARERRCIRVDGGHSSEDPVPAELLELLGEDTFVVVPLFSPDRSFGVIIADNFVTRQPITDSDLSELELFASQASLAIDQSHLYLEMQGKISELEALNEEVNKNKDLLIEAERYAALGQMSAQLVHAIRNPITSIGGVSRILSRKITDDSLLKYVNVVVKETARLESTLEDLFDFVSHADIHLESASLYSMIRKTLMLVQTSMVKQQISWELNFPEPEPEIMVDRHQMRQVFLHLIRNAVEAMSDGGKLVISVGLEDEQICITVKDTGSGILDQHMDKAKDPFFTTKTYGTGMGLALVDRVMKAHGGYFLIRKCADGGLEARVFLPLQ